IAALALRILVHLALHIGQLAGIVLRLGIDLGRARGAQVEPQQPAFLIHPGGEFLERGIDQAPIAFAHAAALVSLKYVQRCMVAMLRWGAKAVINRAVPSVSGRSGSL